MESLFLPWHPILDWQKPANIYCCLRHPLVFGKWRISFTLGGSSFGMAIFSLYCEIQSHWTCASLSCLFLKCMLFASVCSYMLVRLIFIRLFLDGAYYGMALFLHTFVRPSVNIWLCTWVTTCRINLKFTDIMHLVCPVHDTGNRPCSSLNMRILTQVLILTFWSLLRPFLPEASIGLWVLLLPASVRQSVHPSPSLSVP